MDEKKIEQLYKLLERAEKEHDAETVSALGDFHIRKLEFKEK